MRKPRDIMREIEEDLNGDIYSQVMFENFDGDGILKAAEEDLMGGYLST